MVLTQRRRRSPECVPSIPLMMIPVRPRLPVQQRNTGDHVVSA
jgi:hypothetical protein